MGEKDKGTNYKTMLEKLLLDFGILKKERKSHLSVRRKIWKENMMSSFYLSYV